MPRTRPTSNNPTTSTIFFSHLNFGVADNSFLCVFAAFLRLKNLLIVHFYCRGLGWDRFDLALEMGHIGRQNSHRVQVHLKLLQVVQFVHLRHEILKRVGYLVWLARLRRRIEAALTNKHNRANIQKETGTRGKGVEIKQKRKEKPRGGKRKKNQLKTEENRALFCLHFCEQTFTL